MHIIWHSRQDWKLRICISIFHVTFPCLYKERKLNFWGDILASFDILNIFICRYCTTCFEYLWYICLFRELFAVYGSGSQCELDLWGVWYLHVLIDYCLDKNHWTAELLKSYIYELHPSTLAQILFFQDMFPPLMNN